MTQFSGKRVRVERSGSNWGAGLLIVVLMVSASAVGTWYFLNRGDRPSSRIQAGPLQAGNSRQGASAQAVTRMADVEARVEKGKVSVSLETVRDKGLIRFVYEGKQELPLLAYVAPSGKVVTAVSMCEPCQSTRFFIQGKNIVCSTCYSQWDLETLKGVTGGCLKYPPDVLPNSIEGDRVLIDETAVAGWKPRV